MWYLLEAAQQGSSNKYPQLVFMEKNVNIFWLKMYLI